MTCPVLDIARTPYWASADERFLDKLNLREDISQQTKEKLVGGNATRFYRVD